MPPSNSKYTASAPNDPDCNATSSVDLKHYPVLESPFLELHTPFTIWYIHTLLTSTNHHDHRDDREAIKMVLLLPTVPIRLALAVLLLLLMGILSSLAALGWYAMPKRTTRCARLATGPMTSHCPPAGEGSSTSPLRLPAACCGCALSGYASRACSTTPSTVTSAWYTTPKGTLSWCNAIHLQPTHTDCNFQPHILP